MVRKIEVLKSYNLVNSKGTKLQLQLGIADGDVPDRYPICNADRGYRWRFIGTEIPMPVRSMYWFNGFAEEIMLEWLKGNGWYPQTCVHMYTGRADVYELPKANEPIKADEEYKLSEAAIRCGEEALHNAVCMLCKAGLKLRAVALYRYIHPSSLVDAKYAVDDIVNAK